MQNAHEILEPLLAHFPPAIKERLNDELRARKHNLREIRLRVDKPVCLCVCGQNIILGNTRITADIISGIFHSICDHSVYSHQNDINSGFVTLKGGHRVGIAGRAVYGDVSGEVTAVRDISSLNFRVAREHIGCSGGILAQNSRNVLIIGPPGSGKTTILRDIARSLSLKHKKVCVVDERGEICGFARQGFDLGVMTDCLQNFKKAQGIDIATRTLSPQVIVFDEIGTKAEYKQLKNCLTCGVDIVTSVHAEGEEDLLKRPFCKKILEREFFDTLVFLGKTPGEILEIKRNGNR